MSQRLVSPAFKSPDAWNRESALQHLLDFQKSKLENYARDRNRVCLPGLHENVSGLSPFLRYRVLPEWEVVSTIRCAIGVAESKAVEKFVDEVCWRTYWKGWLCSHPDEWPRYRAGVEFLREELSNSVNYLEAIEGRTPVQCFNEWARELMQTGYLHNHARMWLASIWVFTLKLPWQLGAHWMLSHLLDGDPASNTLSWRWVAGLHTKGKAYLARSANINLYTDGRFIPKDLNETPPAAELEQVAGASPEPVFKELSPLPQFENETTCRAGSRLIVWPDDLLGDLDRTAVWPEFLVADHSWSLPAGSSLQTQWRQALQDDFCRRAQKTGARVKILRSFEECRIHLASLFKGGLTGHPLPWSWIEPQVGSTQDVSNRLLKSLEPDCGQNFHESLSFRYRRRWDALFFPYCQNGFFALKRSLPDLFLEFGLSATGTSTGRQHCEGCL